MVTNAFRPSMALKKASVLRMSEQPNVEQEVDDEPDFIPVSPEEAVDGKLFDMNRRVRLGRSRDQDGKSNIWSIEPRMQVVEEEEGGSLKQNLIVGALTITAAIGVLPLFAQFSKVFPDPSDF
jgi:hypothetical protein